MAKCIKQLSSGKITRTSDTTAHWLVNNKDYIYVAKSDYKRYLNNAEKEAPVVAGTTEQEGE